MSITIKYENGMWRVYYRETEGQVLSTFIGCAHSLNVALLIGECHLLSTGKVKHDGTV